MPTSTPPSPAVDIAPRLARELGLDPALASRVIALIDAGNTIPFIARYRKELTAGMDEVALRRLDERLKQLRNLVARQDDVIRLIGEQGKLTPELEAAIRAASTSHDVDDLYRPFRPKRKTRASVARERGLAPLAERLLAQPAHFDPVAEAAGFVDPERGVPTVEDALAGARDIVAEQVADDAEVRRTVRAATLRDGVLRSKAAGVAANAVYEMYYDFAEAVARVQPHRVLAINRGEREEVLRVAIEAPDAALIAGIVRRVIRNPRSPAAPHLQAAVEDAYRRLIAPAIEREVRSTLTERAEEQAVKVFGANLRNLLLQPPLRGRAVLGVDPAYRTGCKLAVVDDTGKLLDVAISYPTPPQNKTAEAKQIFAGLIRRHRVSVIAIGNGTGSRETELFVADLLRELAGAGAETATAPQTGVSWPIGYVMVNEAGASVYSASPLAGEEFPHLDVSERSAVSIARRLQDPLAELVKIEPRSIGVGQYQHDVEPKRLEESLGAVVESAVNTVGVNLNTASPALLGYVSGLTPAVARAVVAYREQRGRFRDRRELRQVPRLGEKTFEQCAGFVRIPDGSQPLDNTPIHPESYPVAETLLSRCGHAGLRDVDAGALAAELGTDRYTLADIIAALLRPGRDPRDDLPLPVLRTDVLKMEDLQPGMRLKGTVRNVVDFGAFVDIGVKQDGLVHISELSSRFVKHPMEVLAVGDVVDVTVLSVDLQRGRISLSMKEPRQ